MKRKRKIKLPKQSVSLTIAVIVLLLILLFFSRFGILRFFINKKIHHFNRNSHAELIIDKISFGGLSSIRLSRVYLISVTNSDTLLKADSVSFRINLFALLKGDVKIGKLYAGNLKMHIIRIRDYNNYSFLLRGSGEKKDTVRIINYAKNLNRLFKAFFYKIPSEITFSNAQLRIETDERNIYLFSERMELQNNSFHADFDIKENSRNVSLTVTGNIYPSDKSLSLCFYSPYQRRFVLNASFYSQNSTLSFDTLRLQVNNNGLKNDNLRISGLFSVNNLSISNPRIAQNEVKFRNTGISFNVNAGEDYLEMDSTTVITCDKLKLNPYIKFVNGNSKQVSLIINKKRFQSQDLFESLPEGLFSTLQGFKTKGELEYRLKFIADFSNPDSLTFSSLLSKHGFSILSFGNSNLLKLNESFSYIAYDKGIPVRTFTVGSENPMFVSLKSISPYLISSVLTSEDGGFFINRGFNEDAFRESIIKNIKEKRFARGGSTITMQLVKNVFLNRNKNIGRKLEEALIVWLIENNNLCSKARMLEVYLNIIEWGPRIYGIGGASEFYFHKKPSQLTLAESIYLASIIPRPKWYKYSFDVNGELRDYVKEYFRFVSQKMLHKEFITQADMDNLKPEIRLKGESLKLLLKDTLGKKVNIDSLYIKDDD